jgi:hypothetical protein
MMEPGIRFGALAGLALASGGILLSACIGTLRTPDDADLLRPEHPLQVHQRRAEEAQRLSDEALRIHLDAHEAAIRAAEPAGQRAPLPAASPEER